MEYEKNTWETLRIEEVATMTHKSVNAIRGYFKKGIFTWHTKDQKTGTRILFFSPCISVRWQLYRKLINKGRKQQEIGQIFLSLFGKKDGELIRMLNSEKNIKDVCHTCIETLTKERKL